MGRLLLNSAFITLLSNLPPMPKIVHVTWSDTNLLVSVPNKMLDNGFRMVDKLSPGWKVQMWNHSEIESYIRSSNELNAKDLKLLFKQKQQQICDLFRLLLLYREGGIYFDLDILVNVNLNNLILPNTRMVLESYHNADFTQDFQGSSPGNPIFRTAIDLNLKRRRLLGSKHLSRDDILWMGPACYLHAVSFHLVGRFVAPRLHGMPKFHNPEMAEVFHQLKSAHPTIVSGHRRFGCKNL